jgi:hypothetical protein
MAKVMLGDIGDIQFCHHDRRVTKNIPTVIQMKAVFGRVPVRYRHQRKQQDRTDYQRGNRSEMF